MTLTEPGGRDAVRESTMRELRKEIRSSQMKGRDTAEICEALDQMEAEGTITQEEGAIARLTARYYTNPPVSKYLADVGTLGA